MVCDQNRDYLKGFGRNVRQTNPGGSDAFKHQRTVGATESKIVFNSNFNIGITCGVGAEVQIASGILVENIDSGRDLLVMQGKHGEDRLNTTRTTEQVARHGLG